MRVWVFVLGASMVCVACGGGAEESEPESLEVAEPTSGAEAPPDEGMQIQGLMGTLTPEDVAEGLQPRMNRFAQCFAERYDALEYVGGSFEMSFRIDPEGGVMWVYPRRSTVGDRATERCLLDVARQAQFRRPRGGGEAEFSWGLEFDAPADVRPPFNWEETHVADTLTENAEDAISTCRPTGSAAGFQVTAYVAPGGQVVAAGAAANDQVEESALDCVTDAVGQWEMPDPGSYPAKVTFVLQ